MDDAYLLDTSIASIAWDGLHKHCQFVRTKLNNLGEVSLSVCSATVGEVEYGLLISPGANAERHAKMRQAMDQYFVRDINRHTAPYYGSLRAELFKRYGTKNASGRGASKEKRPEELLDKTTARELGIQENDLWIVSLAVQYDLLFITKDSKMQRILDIALEIHKYQRWEVWELPQ